MQQLRKHGDELLAAQRAQAAYATRPHIATRDQAQVLAKDLVNALDAGNLDEARRIALALKPLIGFLPKEN